MTPQLLHTRDFRRFEMTQLSGPGAKNKGMALFPRRIGGRYVALSRADRESNAITTSTDLHHWDTRCCSRPRWSPGRSSSSATAGRPSRPTSGWLVLTHGVGAMREYSIGAVLLDLDDPTVVIGRLRRPHALPESDERSGYVPNVVYSCGALHHGRTLVVPYGCSDHRHQDRPRRPRLPPRGARPDATTSRPPPAIDRDRTEPEDAMTPPDSPPDDAPRRVLRRGLPAARTSPGATR